MSQQGERTMNPKLSMALPALLALGALGLWGSSAAAQTVGGGAAYAPGYYYAPSPVCFGSGYNYAARQATGSYYSPRSAPYYAARAPSFRTSLMVPGGSSGTNYPAPSGR